MDLGIIMAVVVVFIIILRMLGERAARGGAEEIERLVLGGLRSMGL